MDSNILMALRPKAMTALRTVTDDIGLLTEIDNILEAGYRDLEATAGIDMTDFYKDGEFDPLILRALLTYTRLEFGEPSNYDQLWKSYWNQKAQLQTCRGYGLKKEAE